MNRTKEHSEELEVLKRYGGKWAALVAMCLDLEKNKIKISDDVSRKLELVRVKIKSGCYSPREVGYLLSDIEGQVVAQATTTGAINVDEWMDTMSCAMSGDLNNEKVSSIPVIKPLMQSSGFMKRGWEGC